MTKKTETKDLDDSGIDMGHAGHLESTAVQTAEQTAITTPMMDFEADAGAGLEGTDQSSYAIPFILLLQGLSPQLDTHEGARPGLMFNTVTEELYKTLEVIPCAFQRRFLRWAPRAVGGGYKGDYDPIDVETGKVEFDRDEDGKMIIEGDELKDTRNHYILYKDHSGDWQPAMLSMASTKIKVSKRWMARIRGLMLKGKSGKLFNPPSFSHSYIVGSKSEESPKGKYHNYDISLGTAVQDPEVYAYAKLFNEQVLSGMVKSTPVDEAAGADEDEAF